MHEKPRILFVDDEKRVLNSMRGLFRRKYDLFLTCEGAEAVKIAAESDVDVIVADQRMPGMTGVEVLARVKEESPRTVRVLLTGYADPSAVEGSINYGEVFRFLSKPCPPQVLRETLSLAIAASRTAPAADKTPVPQPPAPEPVDAQEPAAKLQSDVIKDDDETQPSLLALDEQRATAASDRSSSHWETMTSVVMSEDNVEESQEVVSLSAPMLGAADVGVVVFTIDSDFASTAIRAVSADRDTILATKLSKVAQALEQKDAGVLVTDYTTNSAILKKIIAALKQRLPQLVTVVVSEARDTTDMISLINFGQVFRYVLKPTTPEQLKIEIDAAVVHHLYLLSNPESTKRHQVNADPVQVPASSTTVNRFLDRIKNLPVPGTDPADTIC